LSKSFSKKKMPLISKKISFPDNELLLALCGEQNAHLNLIEKKIGVSVNLRGNVLLLKGGDWEVELAEKVFCSSMNCWSPGIRSTSMMWPMPSEF
jgi:phosphate starvation-inducible protein PhoH